MVVEADVDDTMLEKPLKLDITYCIKKTSDMCIKTSLGCCDLMPFKVAVQLGPSADRKRVGLFLDICRTF